MAVCRAKGTSSASRNEAFSHASHVLPHIPWPEPRLRPLHWPKTPQTDRAQFLQLRVFAALCFAVPALEAVSYWIYEMDEVHNLYKNLSIFREWNGCGRSCDCLFWIW